MVEGVRPTDTFEENEVVAGTDVVRIEVMPNRIQAEPKALKLLVTGGAGYIGGVTTEALIEAGHSVVVVDDLSHGHQRALHPEARFVQGKVGDTQLMRKVLTENNIEAVLHFAALIEAGESMKRPIDFYENNTGQTTSLLKAMQDCGVNTLVFSSTAALYGNPTEIPITETSALVPTNIYGKSKLIVEQILKDFYEKNGFRYAALRYFNASGATKTRGEDHMPESHLIPIAFEAAQGKRAKLKLFGTDYPTPDGTCVRDYIHVADLARAHVMALTALQTGAQGQLIYNLGTGKGFSNLEVIEAVGKVLGKPVPYEKAERRDGDPAILVASSEKIRAELGWSPEYTEVEDIIATAWEWRKQHPNGYKE